MINSPVLIVGCPRSGTTLLYTILSEVPDLWSIGGESKAIIERYHSPAAKGWVSGALSADDLTDVSRAFINKAFLAQAASGSYWRRVNEVRHLANRSGFYRAIKRRSRRDAPGSAASRAIPGGGLALAQLIARWRNRIDPPQGPIRLLEKTPENCLRLPFLAALFPDARVIFLVRDGKANVHSLMEGWRQPHLFPGYRTPIPVTARGQERGRWAFTLIPGWQELVDKPLEEICARQWIACNQAVLDYGMTNDSLPILTIRYEELVGEPKHVLESIAKFLGIIPQSIPAYGYDLPYVNVVSRPDAEKWRREFVAIRRVEPLLNPMMLRLGYPP